MHTNSLGLFEQQIRQLQRVFGVSSIIALVLLLVLLSVFMPARLCIEPIFIFLALISAWRWPISILGLVLGLLPFLPLPTMAATAAGIPHIQLLSAIKEVVMLICLASLWCKNRMLWHKADTVLIALLVIGLLWFSRSGNAMGIKDDFEFIIPYFVGRVLFINTTREICWARMAILLISALALGGILEAVVLGPTPRVLLMGLSDPKELPFSFSAYGYSGFRPGSFTASPLEFGPFCMIGLLLLLIYQPYLSWSSWLSAVPLLAGLILSLSRGAWLGVFLGAGLTAIRHQRKAVFACVSVAAITAVIALSPILGMQDYLSTAATKQDISLAGHETVLIESINSILTHPFGSGAGSVGPRAVDRNSRAINVDGGYITLGLEYGILAPLLLMLFYLLCLTVYWDRSPLGEFATAMVFTTVVLQIFMTLHIDFNLCAWMLLPVGMSMRKLSHGPKVQCFS